MMKVGIIGRTRILLETAKLVSANGFTIPFIHTCKTEPFYNCPEEEFEILSKEIGADFYNDTKINTEERILSLSAYECDVALSLNWLTVLKSPVCNAFKHGVWNAHAGDLPRYRGNACPNWAIINGEERVGLSIHKMVPDELDSGDVLKKEYFPLSQDSYIGDVYRWLDQRIPAMFLSALLSLRAGSLTSSVQSQNPADILRCYPRKPGDAAINWCNSAAVIHRLIRASSHPFSGAFCKLESGEVIRIWAADLVDHNGAFLAVPGQVLYCLDVDPVIACGAGLLRLRVSTFDDGITDAKPAILKSLRNRLISAN